MNDRASLNVPNYAAPPAYVPLSGAAVTALVLSIVFVLGAMIGPPWCEAIPLLIAILSFIPISKGTRRGRVVAIIAIAFALLGGVGGMVFQRFIATGISSAFSPVVRALSKDDRPTLSKWAGDGPEADARIDRWTERAKAAWTSAGAFNGDLTASYLGWGFAAGLIARPDYSEEFAPKGSAAPVLGATFWFRAPCAKGDVFVAFDFGTPEKFNAAMTRARSETPSTESGARPAGTLDTMFAGKVDEIRFFR